MSSKVTFDYSKAMTFIKEHEIDSMKEIVGNARDILVGGTGAGNDYIGWVDLPVDYDKEEFARIQKAAEKIKRIDRERRYYYESHTGMEWGSIEAHQVLLNVSRLGLEGTVDLLEMMYRA